MRRIDIIEELSEHRVTLLCSVICALVGAVATVFLTKLLDTAFPSSFIIKEETYDTSAKQIYAFEFGSHSSGKQFLGIVTEYPIWYYRLSVGNATWQNTGIIHVSVDFPTRMRTIWALTGDKTIRENNAQTLHFQIPQLTARHGVTFAIAVASLDLPDINKVQIRVTSTTGDFAKVPSARYKNIFTERAEK